MVSGRRQDCRFPFAAHNCGGLRAPRVRSAPKYQSQGTEAPDTDYYEQYPTRFYTQLVSIEADKIKDYITEKGMDYEGFYQGEYGLIAGDTPELFPDNMTLHFQTGQLNQYKVIPNDKSMEIPIGGFLPSSYYGGLSSDTPYVFVSDAGMEKLAPEAYISSLGIDVTSSNEKIVLSNIRELCNQSGQISIISKTELIEGLHSAKITLYTLGGGIAFVLAFIGVLNFANIMFTNIEARKHELYVMERIGMTKKTMSSDASNGRTLVCPYFTCLMLDIWKCSTISCVSSLCWNGRICSF